MRERPILFSGPMVQAINDDRKTVTRRVVDITHRTPGLAAALLPPAGIAPRPGVVTDLCPYGQPGDHLWVRETWAYYGGDEYLYQQERPLVMYRATWDEDPRRSVWNRGEPEGDRRWRPSIHMPRWASRTTLNVKSVRVERLHEITDADAVLEGIRRPEEISNEEADVWPGAERALYNGMNQPRDVFRRLWDSLNGERGPWASNPWVWRVEFRKLTAAELAAA